jgi:hypothetical protein
MVKEPELSLPSSKQITGMCREAAETGAQTLSLSPLKSNIFLPYESRMNLSLQAIRAEIDNPFHPCILYDLAI